KPGRRHGQQPLGRAAAARAAGARTLQTAALPVSGRGHQRARCRERTPAQRLAAHAQPEPHRHRPPAGDHRLGPAHHRPARWAGGARSAQ
ncbi:Microcin-H47 secretion/processing ATP-binding protein MchF, partial [Daphnia magna]